MEIAKIIVKGTTGFCCMRKRIPAGLVGGTVSVVFEDPQWASITKTVIFRGAETRIAQFDGSKAIIPAETVAQPGLALFFGLWGYDTKEGLQLPLIEVRIGIVETATDPEADPGTDPSLPVWADLQNRVEDLEKRPAGSGIDVSGAAPGQTVKIAAVDDEGRPTAWDPADFPESGGNVDLTGYATEQWVKNQKYLTEVPDGYAKAEDIPTKPEDIGADPAGTSMTAISQHNTSVDSHNDIRLELKAINDRLTAFFDSDDQTLDELSEIVAYITSNKTLIESITTGKVSVADIINNLTTNVANKPLSAAQGVVLKGLIDAVSNNLSNCQPKGDYALRSELPTVPEKVSAFENDAGYLTETDKKEILSEVKETSNIPDYWQEHIDSKIATIKTLQDAGGRNCFAYVVLTDMHLPSNLGKNSSKLAKAIMEACNIRFALCLGDIRTRGILATKEQAQAEWESVEEILSPIRDKLLQTQGNHDAGYGTGDYDGDGDNDNYAYEFTPAEMFARVYRKAQSVGDIHYDNSGTAYYIDDVSNRVRYIILNTHLNFDGNAGYSSYETVNGMAKYPSMNTFRYTQCQYDFLTNDALMTVPGNNWSVIIGSHVPINQTGEMPEFPVMVGVLNAFAQKTTYSGIYEGTASGSGAAYTNRAEPLPDNTTDTTKWVNGYRFSSSGISAQSGTTVSNLIPCTNGDTIRIKGVTLREGTDRIQILKPEGDAVTYFNTNLQSGAETIVTYAGLADGVYTFTINSGITTVVNGFRFAMPTPTDANAVIVTVNEEIVDGGGPGYDHVEVNADFSSAKGNLICYNGGHAHADTDSKTCYNGGSLSFPIITTRCDAKEEVDATLKAERVAGTTTEQSFDVFTVNTKTRKIYATKIGAGADRVIPY